MPWSLSWIMCTGMLVCWVQFRNSWGVTNRKQVHEWQTCFLWIFELTVNSTSLGGIVMLKITKMRLEQDESKNAACLRILSDFLLSDSCFLTSAGASEEIHGGPSPTGRLPGLLSKFQEDVSHPPCTGWKDPGAQPAWEETGQAHGGGGRAEEKGSGVKGATAQRHYLPWVVSHLPSALWPHASYPGAPVYVLSSRR